MRKKQATADTLLLLLLGCGSVQDVEELLRRLSGRGVEAAVRGLLGKVDPGRAAAEFCVAGGGSSPSLQGFLCASDCSPWWHTLSLFLDCVVCRWRRRRRRWCAVHGGWELERLGSDGLLEEGLEGCKLLGHDGVLCTEGVTLRLDCGICSDKLCVPHLHCPLPVSLSLSELLCRLSAFLQL